MLPLGCDLTAAAAADQLHPVQAQISGQYPVHGTADLPGGDVALSPARQLENAQGAQDPRMHREFIHVHLGEYRVQMHERPGAGDLEGQHRVDLGGFVGKNSGRQLLDGLRLGALGNAHAQHPAAQVQDIAALDAEILVRRVIQGHLAGVVRVMPQHVIAIQRLPVAGGRKHMVQADAPANAGKGVPGEIQVGDRRHQESHAGMYQAGQPSLLIGEHILIRHALHGLEHQEQRVLNVQQIPLQICPVAHGGAAGPPDGLGHKLTPQDLVTGQHLSR